MISNTIELEMSENVSPQSDEGVYSHTSFIDVVIDKIEKNPVNYAKLEQRLESSEHWIWVSSAKRAQGSRTPDHWIDQSEMLQKSMIDEGPLKKQKASRNVFSLI